MTEAMPFLQKAILLSYAPRPFRGGIISTYFYPQNMNMLNQSIYPLNTVIIKTNLLKFVNIFTEKDIIV